MILAQISNQLGQHLGQMGEPHGYAAIGWVSVILAAIVVGLRQGIGFWRDLQDRATRVRMTGGQVAIADQPLAVRLASEFMKKEECQMRHGTLEKQIDELRRERRADTSELHEKINQVAREVSALIKSTELQNQQLARMDVKLDRLSERRGREAG